MKVRFFEDFFGIDLKIEQKDFSEVSTDTRSLKAGALFIALKGPHFDGNNFVEEALSKGALAALVSDKKFKNKKSCHYVDDTLKSFQQLAKAWQEHIKPQVISITGSNGKTTSKFFTAQLLNHFFKVCFSPKSFNNEIGVPITQSMLKEDDEVLLSEIGTNAPGEIAFLSQMVEPDIALVTTVGPSHLEGFGNVKNVAKEKETIYFTCPEKTKIGIFNLDNNYTLKMSEKFQGKTYTFSKEKPEADVFLQAKQINPGTLYLEGHILNVKVKKTVPLFGLYNVYNIMVATTTALALGVSTEKIVERYSDFKTPWGRSEIYKSHKGFGILFDGYNSNLQSMKALFSTLKELKSESFYLFLGEMLELGEQTPFFHKELGRAAAELKPLGITFVGPSFKHFREGFGESKSFKSAVFTDSYNEELAIQVESMLETKDWLVIKGSRGARLERVLQKLVDKKS